MKKLMKLLLVGLLSMSLIGCSSDTSSSSSDTSNDSTETSSDDNADNVITKSSGNVMQADPNESELNKSAFGTLIDPEDIKSVTFLDNENSLPFEIDDDIDSYDISENDDGCVMLYAQRITQNTDMYDVYIVGDGGVDANPSCKYLFVKFTNLTSVNFNDCFYTSNATNMCGMFQNCSSLTSLDLSGFDTSNVTDMSSMFYNCSSLTSLDISGFDTSNVTDMEMMFYECESLTNLDVSSFDTSNVTSMKRMFQHCESLTSLDISGFDTSNVTDMHCMFSNCKSLTSLDITNFDMSNVEDDSYMFNQCPAGDEY